MKKEIEAIVKNKLDEFEEVLQIVKEEIDIKMVKVRQDFDIGYLKK